MKDTAQPPAKLVFPLRKYRGFVAQARQLRKELSARLIEATGGIVQHGPLTGLRLPAERTWGNDAAVQLFGIYEQQLFPYLCGHKNAVLVDIGAADGFWAVGLVQAGHFDRAICFESRAQSRAAIAELARGNGVQDKIAVHGSADETAWDTIRRDTHDGETRVILIDIEGGEFDLLSPDFLRNAAGSTVIVELHPWAAAGDEPVDALIAASARWFDATLIDDAQRDVSGLLAHARLPDYLRYVLISEERARQQQWLILTPRKV